MSEPESSFPMGGPMAGPGSGSPGGLPEDMLFARLQHLEHFLSAFRSHLIDAKIAGTSKRFQILAIERPEAATETEVYFQWKVTRGVGDNTYDMAGGTLWDKDTAYPVSGVSLSGSGTIVLHIVRGVDSREILTITPTLLSSVPDDDYANQYRPIAEVSPILINQLQFEEIRISEEMVSSSGELIFRVYEASHRKSYALP